MTAAAVSSQNSHAVPGMSFDPERLAARRATLGASEIAAVAGLNSRKTALDVYYEKIGAVEPFQGNQFTEWGLRLEQPIADKYAEVTGATLRKSDTVVAGWMSCTPDRVVVVDGQDAHGVEIKRFGEYREHEFGALGTDEVPDDLAVQCHWSMMVTGLKRWDAVVLLGQADFRIYTVREDPALHRSLHMIGRDFWIGHVEAKVPPAPTGGATVRRLLNRVYTQTSADLIDAEPEHLADARVLADLRAERKHCEEEIEKYENKFKIAIGGRSGIRGVCTWKQDRTGRVLWKDVAAALGANAPEHKALLESCTSEPARKFVFSYKEG